jgi:hypothetical protein
MHFSNTNSPIDFPQKENRIEKILSQVPTDISGKWMNISDVETVIKLTAKECSKIIVQRDVRFDPAPEILLLGEFGVDI